MNFYDNLSEYIQSFCNEIQSLHLMKKVFHARKKRLYEEKKKSSLKYE